jgi:hypothetical protein
VAGWRRGGSKLNDVDLVCTPYAKELIWCALLVAAAAKVNPAVSFTFETSANARACALGVIAELFRCALGGQPVHEHFEDCATSSAMTGKRGFLSSSRVVPAVASPDAPTLQRIVRDYLSDFATAGCEYVVSATEPAKLCRLLSGFFASSVSTASGCAVRDGKPIGFARYRVHVDCVRTGQVLETFSIALSLIPQSARAALRAAPVVARLGPRAR